MDRLVPVAEDGGHPLVEDVPGVEKTGSRPVTRRRARASTGVMAGPTRLDNGLVAVEVGRTAPWCCHAADGTRLRGSAGSSTAVTAATATTTVRRP